MTETDRYLKETLKPTFEEKFIKRKFLGCFIDYSFIVIKKRTLLIYQDEENFRNNPD